MNLGGIWHNVAFRRTILYKYDGENEMKKGYIAICACTNVFDEVAFEFVEYFTNRKSAIDYIAASIGREWESMDCSTRNEKEIEKSIDELKRIGETRKNCGEGSRYVWKLVEVCNP